MRHLSALVAVVLLLSVTPTPALARQNSPGRRLTTVDALKQFPGYFHLQNVLLRGEFTAEGGRVTFRAAGQDMPVELADGAATLDGPVEIRAQLVDVGRLEIGDPRVPFSDGRTPERWPRPGEELVLHVTGVTAAQPATMPSIRALALEPWRFDGQKVTVIGQFRARNVFGDLPAAPGKARYEFVVRSADGAIWVTGLRPKGRSSELAIDSRVDTSRWVQISGTVARERGHVMIEGTMFADAQAPAATASADEDTEPPAPVAPLEVVFSSPTPNESDVPSGTTVRLQFSRGVNPATLTGNIRAFYAGAAPDAAPIPILQSYDAASRAIVIRFPQPLERFSAVRIELLGGLKAFDGGAFAPWTLSFTIGD